MKNTYDSGSVEGLGESGNLLLVLFSVILKRFDASLEQVDLALVTWQSLVLFLDLLVGIAETLFGVVQSATSKGFKSWDNRGLC